MKISILALVSFSALLLLGCTASNELKQPHQPMSMQICGNQGGNWSEVEIMRDQGDQIFWQCECPGGNWIWEGAPEACISGSESKLGIL